MSNRRIEISKLLDKNNINLNCRGKELSSSMFWYYANIEAVSNILCSHSFWVSNLLQMNDKTEVKLHFDNASKIHALCFCNCNTEKIPMWYLYAGLSGWGASIGITPSEMLKFIKSIDEIQVIGKDRILKKDKDYEIRVGWIYYRKSMSEIKYRNKWFKILPEDIDEFENGNYFIKEYPWEYENEFRIVFINHTEITEDRFIVKFPKEILKNLKLRFAPEVQKDELWEIISQKEGFKEYFQEKILYSNLQIDMELYNKNIEDMQQYKTRLEKNKRK